MGQILRWSDTSGAPLDPAGEAQSFVNHIELGVQHASEDPDALLLFSGGQTRQAAGPRSEGLSYWVVAEVRCHTVSGKNAATALGSSPHTPPVGKCVCGVFGVGYDCNSILVP